MNKRGLSTIVTTLILILLVLVAVGVVWIVIRNVLKSGVEDIDIEKFTIRLSIENVKMNNEIIDITVKRNPGAGELTGIKFVLKNETDSVVVVRNVSLSELELNTFSINTTFEGISSVKEFSIYPIIKTSTGKEISGSEYNYKISSSSSSTGGGCTPVTYFADSDGDTYGNATNTTTTCPQPSGYVTNNTDCNDADVNEKPGQIWYKDNDNDLYSDGINITLCTRPVGYKVLSELTATFGDCNDANSSINPGASESCNFIDDDCDGSIDEGGVCVTFLKTWPGLVSWWRFEGNYYDEMGRNNGTCTNCPTLAGGKFGQAYQFDGVNDYIYNATSLAVGNIQSVLVWVKASMTGQAENSGIFSSADGSYLNTVQIDIGGGSWGCSGQYRFRGTSDTGSNVILCFDTYTTGWHHLVATNVGSNNVSVYLDGVLKNSSLVNTGFNFRILKIGANRANSAFFNGTIDDVMLFNRTLTASEISQIYIMNLSS